MGGAFLLLYGGLNDLEPEPPVTGVGGGYFQARYFGAGYFAAGYLGGGEPAPPAPGVCPIPPLNLFLPPDALLYPHDFSCYREVEVLAANGEPDLSECAVAVDGAYCYFEEGDSVQGNQGGFIRGETDNMFTYDTVRMVLGLDVRGQDVLRGGVCAPEPGRYYRVEGNPKKFTQLGMYQEVKAAKLEDKPDWVPET
jgi:hypothetical protein